MTTPTAPSSMSARKIANYSQSISSNVTNLLTELGRINNPPAAPASSNNNAILLQLQQISSQIQATNTRLDRMEKLVNAMDERFNAVTSRFDVMENTLGAMSDLLEPLGVSAVERYNAEARKKNKKAKRGGDPLVPLRDSLNRVPPDFPKTLGHLALGDIEKRKTIASAYNLDIKEIYTGKELTEFIGVNYNYFLSVCEHYILPEDLAKYRARGKAARDAECEAAGPPTPQTIADAEKHNIRAREHNRKARSMDDRLIPLHDSRNIPVKGFPSTLYNLANPGYRENILFMLREYGLNAEKEGHWERWIEFVGSDYDTVLDWVEDGPLTPKYFCD